MDPVTSHAIDLIEVAYDLDKPDSHWLADLTETGMPIFDQGLGVFSFEFVRPAGAGGADAVVRNMHASSLPDDFASRFEAARTVISPEFVRAVTPPGYAGTWSEIAKDHPEEFERLLGALGFEDLLGILAVDPDGVGVDISAPLPKKLELTPKSRERWQMLGAHITAAFRLRHALMEAKAREDATSRATALPYDAEAVLDAKGFRLVDAAGPAQEPSCVDLLRRAARRVDRARGKLRAEDPERALESWKALVRGRWSMVDWFDTDGRRFVLAMPNPPRVRDPRGLSEQECRVALYAALGESNKLIAYRLGLSQGRVSGLLKSALQKLGLKKRAQLVHAFGSVGFSASGQARSQADDEGSAA